MNWNRKRGVVGGTEIWWQTPADEDSRWVDHCLGLAQSQMLLGTATRWCTYTYSIDSPQIGAGFTELLGAEEGDAKRHVHRLLFSRRYD